MTPKEKAQQLFDQFNDYPLKREWIKRCAMIAVDEIWAALESEKVFEKHGYWQDVKREIENL
jgi:hypothetical protein